MKRLEFKQAPQGGEIQNKSTAARVEIKADGEGGILHIKAYALAFGNIDSWGDIIMPGACDEFLAGPNADRMALCWQHDRATVIGKITDKGVDDYGMWIEADILPTTAGNDAAILLKNGAVKEFSIGYRATKYHWEKREGYEYDIRILEAIEVIEVSPVTTAANPAAILVSALVCNLILNAAVGGYFHLGLAGQPVAHTDGLWNALGMYLAGFGCVLLGGCPLRQLVMAGEGNSDSTSAVFGLMAGAAFAHNFGLASSGEGPTANGKIAVIIGILAVAAIACINTFRRED